MMMGAINGLNKFFEKHIKINCPLHMISFACVSHMASFLFVHQYKGIVCSHVVLEDFSIYRNNVRTNWDFHLSSSAERGRGGERVRVYWQLFVLKICFAKYINLICCRREILKVIRGGKVICVGNQTTGSILVPDKIYYEIFGIEINWF